jgi:hypothetical protein
LDLAAHVDLSRVGDHGRTAVDERIRALGSHFRS